MIIACVQISFTVVEVEDDNLERREQAFEPRNGESKAHQSKVGKVIHGQTKTIRQGFEPIKHSIFRVSRGFYSNEHTQVPELH